MDRQSSYFILSGVISLSLFLLFLSLFFYMLFSSSKIDTYALTKDNYISISLAVATVETKTSKKPVVVQKEELQVVEEVKEVDIGDLFSDVWTKDIKIEKKEKKVDSKRLEQILKKIKTKDENKVDSLSKIIETSEADVSADENKKSSSGDEVNEYFAKIQAIVYKHFDPPANSQGYAVKAVIELSALGKVLDFRILSYSSNTALNQECDKIKRRLTGVLFPVSPNNKSYTIKINLIPEEKR